MKIKLKDKIIKQLEANERIKTLGVRMSPSLNRDDECDHDKNKLIISIKSIMRKEMKMCQYHTHFNISCQKICVQDVEQFSLIQNKQKN